MAASRRKSSLVVEVLFTLHGGFRVILYNEVKLSSIFFFVYCYFFVKL